MNRILCGLPMSGKTTIGKLLAEKLHLNFIDTDALIESAYSKITGRKSSCRQIFLKHGEIYFRKLESNQIEELKEKNQSVISLGGGALNNQNNVTILQSIGRIIYLKAPVEILWKRIVQKGIPAYLDPRDPERSFYALADQRSSLYEKASYAVIETKLLNEQETVEIIIQMKEIKDGK